MRRQRTLPATRAGNGHVAGAGDEAGGPGIEAAGHSRRRAPLGLCALFALLTGLAGQARAVPSFTEVRAAHRSSDIILLDRSGVPIQTLRVDKTVRRLRWVPLEDLSPALLEALVLSEDRRFAEHAGVDWGAVATSAWANLWNRRTRGASTLTMQLAGLIDDGLARPAGGRSLGQKLGQALTARQLEAGWRKSQILEAYLNEVPFRGEIVGIGALAESLFGKRPSGLDREEAAIAAALVRGPNAPAVTVAERACGVLRLQGLGCSQIAAITEATLARRGSSTNARPLDEQIAPHFARRVVVAAGPAEQRSTLDARLQRLANASLRQQLAELDGRQVEDGAVVVLDNASGEVLAWVGSSGPSLSDAPDVDGVLAKRQPGSTLKPFVYQLAFERRLITPASLIDDAPAQIATAGGLYQPQDYAHAFKGWVSARTALAASLNLPAVRVGAMLGPDALVERLNAFGFALPHTGGYYGNALALGSADVDLLALTNAYRALANGGRYAPVTMQAMGRGGSDGSTATPIPGAAARGSTPPESSVASAPSLTSVPVAPAAQVADPAAVFLVTDILADNTARVRTFGSTSPLLTRGHAAVKTGTSKDMRDNWCIGYTDRYTVGVWVGNASGAAMRGVSGISGAAPVWQALVAWLHADRPSRPPAPPSGVVALPVRFDASREPARQEFFLAGTERTQQRAGAQVDRGGRFGITSPRDGSIYAIDPDMPPDAQRITFEGEAGTWVLDGRRLGAGPRWPWAPWPGRHRLALLDAGGAVLQSIGFEVRGAGIRDAASLPATGAKTDETGRQATGRRPTPPAVAQPVRPSGRATG